MGSSTGSIAVIIVIKVKRCFVVKGIIQCCIKKQSISWGAVLVDVIVVLACDEVGNCLSATSLILFSNSCLYMHAPFLKKN